MKNLLNPTHKAEILERLHKLNHHSQRRWGKMTAHQMVCHLTDSFKAAIGEKYASPSGNIAHRTLLKWVALAAPVRWPQGVKTRPEMDQEAGGSQPGEFEADLEELERVLDKFTKTEKEYKKGVHPVFGKMREKQWQRWGYLHVDHHLRQFGL